MTKISVCVPTYERPETLIQLLRTFQAQDYPDRELCVADDGRSNQTERFFNEQVPDRRIRYRRNAENLGFGRNLHEVMGLATGDILVVLGDDDFLASPTTLREYVSAFENHPTAHFAYANLLQVDQRNRCTLLYPLFDKTSRYRAGAEALENLWLRSILITGMAFRRSPALDILYPEAKLLFPQVELVGKLLKGYDGLGISSYLCAVRAHSDQLGFHAIKGNRIKGGEHHGVIEVTAVWRRLLSSSPQLQEAESPIQRQLARAFLTNMPNEKVLTGNRFLTRNFRALVELNQSARRSATLWATYLTILVLPRRLVVLGKRTVRYIVARRQLRRARLDPAVTFAILPGSRASRARQSLN